MKTRLTISVDIDFTDMLSEEGINGAMLALGAKSDKDVIKKFAENILAVVETHSKDFKVIESVRGTVDVANDDAVNQELNYQNIPEQYYDNQEIHPEQYAEKYTDESLNDALNEVGHTPEADYQQQVETLERLKAIQSALQEQEGVSEEPYHEPENEMYEEYDESVEVVFDEPPIYNEPAVDDGVDIGSIIQDGNEQPTELTSADVNEIVNQILESLFQVNIEEGQVESVVVSSERVKEVLIQNSELSEEVIVVNTEMDNKYIVRFINVNNNIEEMIG